MSKLYQKINGSAVPLSGGVGVVNNLNSTSTKDALSANMGKVLNERNDYSTSERVVGKWIDDKPIYRKVIPIFENSQLVSGITQIVGSDYEYTGGMPSNIDKILNYNVPSLRNTINPYVDNFTGIGVGPSINFVPRLNGTFYFNPGYPENAPNWCYCILEYTKTTD